MEGCIRMVPGYIQEEILQSERGAAQPYIEYHVKSGPFPVSYHRGRVTFEAEGASSTKVVWTCSFTPYWCLGPFVSAVVKLTFGMMLRHLAKVSAKL